MFAREAALRRSCEELERARRRVRRPATGQRVAALGVVGLAFLAGLSLEGPLLGALAARWPRELGVERVAIVGCNRVDPAEVAAAAAPAVASLARPDREAVAESVRAHPWVAGAHVLALPPATLLIGVHERQPIAVVDGGGAAGPGLVDAQGSRFASAAAEDLDALPRIVGPAGSGTADDADRLLSGLRVVLALPVAGLPPAREVALPGVDPHAEPTLSLRGMEATVVLGPGDLEPKLSRLARLIAADLPELARAEGIDLRFAERAILRVSPSQTGTDKRRGRADARPRPGGDPSGSSGDPDEGG